MAITIERVRSYLSNHKDEIIRTYRAKGVGIGKETNGNHLIVVYIDEKNPMPEEPVFLDGIKLKFIQTGPFDLQT